MRSLSEVGLIVPEEIPGDDETVPLDFTTLGNRDLGGLHSRFAVRHSYALFHSALGASRLVRYRRRLRIAEASFRVRHSGEKKTDVDALMEEDKEISKVRDKIALAEAKQEIVQAVASGYEAIRNAASREISRRLGERAQSD